MKPKIFFTNKPISEQAHHYDYIFYIEGDFAFIVKSRHKLKNWPINFIFSINKITDVLSEIYENSAPCWRPGTIRPTKEDADNSGRVVYKTKQGTIGMDYCDNILQNHHWIPARELISLPTIVKPPTLAEAAQDLIDSCAGLIGNSEKFIALKEVLAREKV